MKKIISNTPVDGATYKRYNANNRGKSAPDCVKRAISMAFNIDYNEASKLLLNKAKEKHKAHWNILPVYEPVIYELGGSKGQTPDEPIQVAEFIDKYAPTGVYIIETHSKPEKYGHGNHLTCCVDGTLYDSWDSSDQYVCQYYLIENATHEFTDIEDHIQELIPEGQDLTGQLQMKYKEKYGLTGQVTLLGTRKKDFGFSIRMKYDDEFVSEMWSIDCVFTPTMTLEAARKKMNEVIKIRMYDRFYAINQKSKQRAEGYSLFYESGYTDDDKKDLYLYDSEKRFFSSLPGWIQPFITYLSVESPGQYSHSYEITALPIKGDPRRELVKFYGYQAADVRDEIARYRKNFERVDEDYSYYEEY